MLIRAPPASQPQNSLPKVASQECADEQAQLGDLLGPAVPYEQVADVIEDVVAAYVELRARPDELFIDTVKRIGVEPFKERVYAAH